MRTAIKIRLKPTKEQEILFRKSCGVARWSYNYFLAENKKYYAEHKKMLKETEVRKHINNVLKPTTHTWLKEVGSNVMKQAVKDADLALKRWLKGISGKPKFKSKHRCKDSFYVNYESLKRTKDGFRGEKIGNVKTCGSLPKIKKAELTDESLGIDLGVKNLAVTSNGKVYKNINKTKKVRRLEKKLKREQRKLSRKIERNIAGYTKNRKPIYKKPLKEIKNIGKQKEIIKSLHKRLSDIRKNHLHQTTSDIVKTKPYRIVMEDLNVKGMMKNEYLAKSIASQCFYEFKRQMKYKCERLGIAFVEVDRWYPSSKTCSHCGKIKKDLKLSDRVFHCECGFTLDRDLNASINLANYQI
ncbi:RNA-guided endonuclease InsQ/TnpB family protein [Enterococcus cecorum]|uniref:RNA-guided endonuclease InsQ/TnpB family protein n=1 Tax=Enterococcus cecorum TaxID=44008 RepID=UPI00200B03DC|nr:transposase [Enterococcus cecorum]